MKSIASYENNEKKGIWEWYSENGALETQINYLSKHRGHVKIYGSEGFTIAEGGVVNEYRSGSWKFYDEKNRLLYMMNYRQGAPFGKYEAYDLDGSIVFRGVIDGDGNLTIEIDEKKEILDTVTGR